MKEYKVITLGIHDERINPETLDYYTFPEFAKKIEDLLNLYAKKGYKLSNMQTLSPDNTSSLRFYIVFEKEI